MATRLSNDYYTIAIANASYGVQVTDLTGAVAMSDVVLEIKSDKQLADTKIKTQTLAPDVLEKIVTSQAATVTMKGNLCTGYEWLLQAATHTASSPYTFADAQAGNDYSYCLYKYYPGTTGSYDVALGCVMSDFRITGESNGILQFESTFRAKSLRRGVASTGGDEVTNIPANTPSTPFLFGDVTATLNNAASTMLSFSLSLSKTFEDDKVIYQNSLTELNELITGYSGTLEYVTIYDDEQDPAVEQNIGSQAATAFDIINLISGDITWTFTCNSMVTDFSLPDKDKGLFEATTSLSLAMADTTEPIEISVVEA